MHISKVLVNDQILSLAQWQQYKAYGCSHFQAFSNLLGVLFLNNIKL